ncbi:MAG: cupin domain-containing protein [Halothiobacillaceae bacterium]
MPESPLLPLHADLFARAVVDTKELPWVESPEPTVQRKLIERAGGDGTRATSLVQFAAGASFPAHTHTQGEEFFVLEGSFCDESGCYPAGSYVINPPGSRHAPFTPEGCVIFVKLHHLPSICSQRIVINTTQAQWLPGLVDGLTVLPLSDFAGEHTALVRWQPNTYFKPHRHFGGEEIFVLEGEFCDETGCYSAGSWIRSPHDSLHTPFTRLGCTIFVKTGHLPIPDSWFTAPTHNLSKEIAI